MEVIVDFIDANRGELGVEPICGDLQVAPSTYYTAKERVLSARALRDAYLIPILVGLWTTNRRVYWVRKLWRAARRAGRDLGRHQVARLMAVAGHRGCAPWQEAPDHQARSGCRPPSRSGGAPVRGRSPQRLVGDRPTYVATWSCFAYVCFITDAFSRMIMGWRVEPHGHRYGPRRPGDGALEAGGRARGPVSHSDAGGQFTSIRYGEALTDLGAVPSIGSVGDAFDNALAESVNGLYKTELTRGPGQGPWRTVGDVELATLSWV